MPGTWPFSRPTTRSHAKLNRARQSGHAVLEPSPIAVAVKQRDRIVLDDWRADRDQPAGVSPVLQAGAKQ